MWPPAWNNLLFTGCPPCQNLGSPCGSHPGALSGGGGCHPTTHAMGPPNPQCSPTGTWTHPGQGGWHHQSLIPQGLGPGGHHQGLPPQAYFQSPQSQGAIHNFHPQAFSIAPSMAFQPHQPGLHHPPSLPAQQETPPCQEGSLTSSTTLPQAGGIAPENTTNLPSSKSSLTITQLEQRLEEVMEKKLESMTKALRSSMASVVEPQPGNPPTVQDRNLGSALQQTQAVHLPQDSRTHALAPRTSAGTDGQPQAMLTSKAKPPTRPEETTSRKRSTRKRSREHRSSSNSGRHPIQRHRGRSYQSSGFQDRGRRDVLPEWTSRSTSQGEKNRSHPIYQRSNAIRARSSNTGSWHQIHGDANTTIFARQSPPITLPSLEEIGQTQGKVVYIYTHVFNTIKGPLKQNQLK